MGRKKKINEEEVEELPVVGEAWLIGRQNDEYTFEEQDVLTKVGNRTYLILAIYDIMENKRRVKIAKKLLGYGERVQLSAFECHLTLKQYEKMIKDILPLMNEDEDLLRIYKLTGNAEIKVWGKIPETFDEEVIII